MGLFVILKYLVTAFALTSTLTSANDEYAKRDTVNSEKNERKSEQVEMQLADIKNDDTDLIQTLSMQIQNQNEVIQNLVTQVQDINRSVRDLQKDIAGLGMKSENLEATSQRQTLSMPSGVSRVRKESVRGPLFKIVEDIKDATYFLAASLVKRENIPFLRRCDKNKDVSSCVRPEVNRLYRDISVPVRIVGGHVENEGRVEIFYRGSWSTVCGHGWDDKDAHVVCKMLGYSSGLTLPGQSFLNGYHFKEGYGVIKISNVECTGEESSVLACLFGKPSSRCRHYDDAGVICEQ